MNTLNYVGLLPGPPPHPRPTALLLGSPLVVLTRALRAFVFGINAFADMPLRLLKVESKDEVGFVFTNDVHSRAMFTPGRWTALGEWMPSAMRSTASLRLLVVVLGMADADPPGPARRWRWRWWAAALGAVPFPLA